MIRLKGWEKALKISIHRHRDLPSEYGVSDCYLIADDAVFAMTGERIYPGLSYDSKMSAAKELIKLGCRNVEDMFAAKFEAVPVMMAQRGDIGVTESNGEICGGVFTALGFMTRDENQIVFLPISRVKSAFKVAR